MVAIYHAFKITCRRFPDCAEIDMNEKENRNHETCRNMQEVCQIKTAGPHHTVDGNFRIEQSESGKNDNGDKYIHQ